MTTVLRGARVVVMDDAGTEHEDGWVLVEDGAIADVGGASPPEADEVVDLRGVVGVPDRVRPPLRFPATQVGARRGPAEGRRERGHHARLRARVDGPRPIP